MRTSEVRSRTVGGLLVVVGVLFLIVPHLDIRIGALLWPFFVIVPGALLLGAIVAGGRDAAGLAVPGSLVTVVGLILLAQAVTGRFETWAYAWGLIPAAVGAGLYLQGRIAERRELVRDGERLAGIGLALFVAFGLMFELLIFHGFSSSWVGRVLVPVLLIFGGLVMFLVPRRTRRAGFDAAPEPEAGREMKPQT